MTRTWQGSGVERQTGAAMMDLDGAMRDALALPDWAWCECGSLRCCVCRLGPLSPVERVERLGWPQHEGESDEP